MLPVQIRRDVWRIEQHRLVEIEGEGVVLPDGDSRVRAHARGHFLAGGLGHHVGVGARGLDDLDVRIEGRDDFAIAVDALRGR